VDTLGLIWAVRVHAASVQDRDGVPGVFAQLEAACPRLQRVYADSAYQGFLAEYAAQFCDWRLQIVQKPPGQQGFAVQPKRWVVERTLAWLGKYRRLSKDYEFQPASSEAVIRWADINRMARLLAPT
jgi:transposase